MRKGGGIGKGGSIGNDHINRIAATTTNSGLKPGDGRYAAHIQCDACNRTIDHVQRTHSSTEQGTARAPADLKVGKKWMLDGGDATVRSSWGGFRYFLVFIDAKTQYVIIYYMKDNSARSFVSATKYVDRLVRVRKGYGLSGFYGDYFSTHLDQNVLGALRADMGWSFEVTPPYCHWLNPYCEVFIRYIKAATRVRLIGLLGKVFNGKKITDGC